MLKQCRKCESDFTASEYQIRKRDFLCGGCKSQYEKKYRLKRKEAGNPVVSGKMPREYHSKYEAQYNARADVRKRRAAQQKSYASGKNRHKHLARWKLRSAVTSGLVIKMPCQTCGNAKSEAHHEDYSKPLDVVWLCRKHHREVHRKAKGK